MTVKGSVPYEEQTDEELIKRLRGGETEIEEYLCNKYKALVRGKARALYIEGGDSEDLLQEGMLGLFKAVRAYDESREASFFTFASQCITNQMYSAVLSANRKKHSILNDSLPLSEIADESAGLSAPFVNGPERMIIEKEDEDRLIRRIREKLSPMENKVLILYLNGLSYREIGRKLNKSDKAIDNALQRIKGKIREIEDNQR